MKKFLMGVVLFVAATCAMALPSSKAVERALSNGDYQSARSMVQEVLREKPDSGKAHLFNAYLLLKEGNVGAAKEELRTARQLDSNVADTALFGRTAAEIERATPVAQVKKAEYKPYVAPEEKSSSGFWTFLFWTGLIVLIAYVGYRWWKKRKQGVVTDCNGGVYYDKWSPPTPDPDVYKPVVPSRSEGPSSFSKKVDEYRPPVFSHNYDAPRGQTHRSGGSGTTIVNNGSNGSGDMLTGMMGGMVLSEMMHHSHGHSHSAPAAPATPVATPAPAYEAPVRTDYETRESSFSTGSSDWSSSSSSSSSSDWGSSSSSSSSDWSSSSSDSGSSGGGDW